MSRRKNGTFAKGNTPWNKNLKKIKAKNPRQMNKKNSTAIKNCKCNRVKEEIYEDILDNRRKIFETRGTTRSNKEKISFIILACLVFMAVIIIQQATINDNARDIEGLKTTTDIHNNRLGKIETSVFQLTDRTSDNVKNQEELEQDIQDFLTQIYLHLNIECTETNYITKQKFGEWNSRKANWDKITIREKECVQARILIEDRENGLPNEKEIKLMKESLRDQTI